jgi:esterase/lipase superfamily enzyme
MGNMSPVLVDVAILATGVVAYALIWFVSRDLSRIAQILARTLPLVLFAPMFIVLQPHLASLKTPPAAPKMEMQKAARPAPPAPEAPQTPEPEKARPAPPSSRAETAPAPKAGEPAARDVDWDVVPIFYGTDRGRNADAKRVAYTSDRGRRLELGRALVTVPKAHQVPNIERPFAIRVPYFQVTVYESSEDPKQHFTIKEISTLSADDFVNLSRERILGGRAFKDQAIVFVHGYNTDFDFALYRSAQMAYDLRFDGATFLYSWPSAGDFTGYVYDRESSEQSEPYLRDFLDIVMRDTGARSVSVIAHSMGNLPLLRVLQALGPKLPNDVRLNQIILAAPDVDRDVFSNLASAIKPYGRGVTMYCSSNDKAMQVARRVAGGIPRAGDVSADGPVVMDGIDTIDVSATSTEYLALNHSSYAESSALLNDIGLLLQTGERPPDARVPILQRVSTPKGDFWRYPAR